MAKAIFTIFLAIFGLHVASAQLGNLGTLLSGLGAGGSGGLPNILNMGFFGNLGGLLGSGNGGSNGGSSAAQQTIQSLLLNQLGYTTTTTPPGPDCIDNLFGNADSLANLKSLLANSVSQELNKCQTDPEVQNGTTILVNQTAQKFLASLTQAGGGSLVDTFTNASKLSCKIQAKIAYCQQLKQEYVNSVCNMCKLIALAFRPEDIKQCACDTSGSITNSPTTTQTTTTTQPPTTTQFSINGTTQFPINVPTVPTTTLAPIVTVAQKLQQCIGNVDVATIISQEIVSQGPNLPVKCNGQNQIRP